MDNDTCVVGLIVEVHEIKPTIVPYTEKTKVNYTYKVQLFKPTTHDSVYSEYRLTLLTPKSDRQLGDKVGQNGVQWDKVEMTKKVTK